MPADREDLPSPGTPIHGNEGSGMNTTSRSSDSGPVRCAQCGGWLETNTPEGLCPHCLLEVARDKPLTPAAAAGYLATIARAIAYAHEHGVLHRDLKPSTILIDGTDQPRMIWMANWRGVVLGRSNVVEIVRPEDPDPRLQLHGHDHPVRALGLTEDGQRVAAVAADDTVRIWDTIHGEELAIGSFVLHYADGGRHELEIQYGRHVRYMFAERFVCFDPRTDTPCAQIAWEGPHAAQPIHPSQLRLYHATWDNPRPEREIISLDVASKMTITAAPLLMALTVE